MVAVSEFTFSMSSQQLVLKQRAVLLDGLCAGGSAEPLDCVLDLLLAWEVLIWEDYLSIRVAEKPVSSNARRLLDVVYEKGEDACGLVLAAFKQVLPEEQKARLCFGKEYAVSGKTRPASATSALLTDRPVLVRKLRDNIDEALDVLMTTGCFTIKDCDGVQLPVYTPSQQVMLTFDYSCTFKVLSLLTCLVSLICLYCKEIRILSNTPCKYITTICHRLLNH